MYTHQEGSIFANLLREDGIPIGGGVSAAMMTEDPEMIAKLEAQARERQKKYADEAIKSATIAFAEKLVLAGQEVETSFWIAKTFLAEAKKL